LGRSRLVFQASSAGDTVALPTVDVEPPILVGVMPDGNRIERVIDRSEIGLGKAPHNQLVVSDPTVSNAHAVILSTSGDYSIVDLGSRNGTYVNGEKLGGEPRTLKHGDTIKLGATVLTFRNPLRAAEITTALPADKVDQVRAHPEGAIEPAGVLTGGAISPGRSAGVPGTAVTEVAASTSLGDQTDRESIAPDEHKDKAKKSDKDKDKKKRKKKEKDERLRAAYIGAFGRILAAVLSVVLTVGIAFYIKEGGLSGKTSVETSKKGRAKLKFGDLGEGVPIVGGSFEASGVVQVSGANGVLFVDDNRDSQAIWMQLDESGHQVGTTRPVELGTVVEDPEGITYGGSLFLF